MQNNVKIAFIGGGNMAQALIGGLADKLTAAANIHVVDINEAALAALRDKFGVSTATAAGDAVAASDVIVLSVKPQQMREVVATLKPLVKQQLVLSIAAGIRAADLSRWLNGHTAIVRTMPNTPALVGKGITGAVAMGGVSASQQQTADAILRAVGDTVWLDDEGKIDAVTALSGSGPAYVFLLVEAMAAAGAKIGLAPEMAMQLARATVAGSGELLRQSAEPASQLRVNVTSPGGTTAAALQVLMAADGIQPVFDKALAAASARSKELAG